MKILMIHLQLHGNFFEENHISKHALKKLNPSEKFWTKKHQTQETSSPNQRTLHSFEMSQMNALITFYKHGQWARHQMKYKLLIITRLYCVIVVLLLSGS